MPRIVDHHNAAHGDFVIVTRDHTNGSFAVMGRLFPDDLTALKAMPKKHGYDVFIAEIKLHHRAYVGLHEVVDPRQSMLPKAAV